MLFALLGAQDASALGPVDVEVAGVAGGGFPPSGQFDSPIGFGLGARAGVSFPEVGAYAGLAFVDYYAGNGSCPASFGSDCGVVHAVTYGAEGGYGLRPVRWLTLRWLLGVGDYAEIVDRTSSSQIHNSPYIAPEMLALVSIGPVLLGADAGVLITGFGRGPGQHPAGASVMLHAQLGLRF
ncbi:MAG: hypothetical protein M3O36_00020 [Myxococcota bacterium]|nr:hypothetical protein [Myxococcota bacterium]